MQRNEAIPPPIETSGASGPSEPAAVMRPSEIAAIAGASRWPSSPSRWTTLTTPTRLISGSPSTWMSTPTQPPSTVHTRRVNAHGGASGQRAANVGPPSFQTSSRRSSRTYM